jgi:hypothetical protein
MPLSDFHFSIGPIDSRCFENSCNRLPRSGLLLLSFPLSLELDRLPLPLDRAVASKCLPNASFEGSHVQIVTTGRKRHCGWTLKAANNREVYAPSQCGTDDGISEIP